jgi:hypothetical protein
MAVIKTIVPAGSRRAKLTGLKNHSDHQFVVSFESLRSSLSFHSHLCEVLLPFASLKQLEDRRKNFTMFLLGSFNKLADILRF